MKKRLFHSFLSKLDRNIEHCFIAFLSSTSYPELNATFHFDIESKHKVMVSLHFHIEFKWNFWLKNKKFYLFIPKNIEKVILKDFSQQNIRFLIRNVNVSLFLYQKLFYFN
jgi:hypothetical protein